MKGLVKEAPQLSYGYREIGKCEDYVVFDHREWDVPALQVGERYQESNRLLYFVFYSNFPESLEFWLELGPGDTDARRKLYDMVCQKPTLFNDPDSLAQWTGILKFPLLTQDQYENLSDDEREQEIRRRWTEFLEKVLPRVEDALKEEAWIWESNSSQEGR